MNRLWHASLLLLCACADAAETGVVPVNQPAPALRLPEGPYVAKDGTLPAATYSWTERTEVFVPRVVPALADQPNRERLLVYGGWQENGVRADTWEWDGYGWIRRQPLHDPGRRAAAAAVFDDAKLRVLLYGGASLFFPRPQISSDRRTWEWDGHDWAAIATANSPPPTMAPASAWDPVGRRMFLFGGFANIIETTTADGQASSSSAGTDELWAFDGTDWKTFPRTEPWPAPRGLCSMSWDHTRNRLVLHSGQREVRFANNRLTFGDVVVAQALGDTWEFDGTTWIQIDTPQIAQAGAANLFWDPIANELRMVVDELFGPSVAPTLRRYTGTTWEQISRSQDDAVRRLITSATFSSANQQALVFSGVLLAASGLPNSDVSLAEELAGNTEFVTLPRASQLVTLDRPSATTEKSGTIVLFGGLSGTSSVASTLRWNGGKWIQLAPDTSPPARHAAAMARNGDDVVLHGGYDAAGGMLADTWSWNGLTWSTNPDEAAVAPPARVNATMFSIGTASYLFGGENGAMLGDTWRYQSGVWSPLAPTSSPTARSQVCSTSTGTRGVLAGGGDDIWAFDGTQWSLVGPTRFGQRLSCSMAYAAETGQALFVGGTGTEATQDLGEVAPRIVSIDDITDDPRIDRPVRRRGAIFAANPLSGGLILAAGIRNDSSLQLADTWQLRLLGQACSDDTACGNGAYCTEGVCCEQTSCGPCGTCLAADHPGICGPRPAGPAPGCDGTYACNAEGRCRIGPGGPCADETACASGACIKSADAGAGICCGIEGCAVQCVEGDQLRNPDGTTSSCAPYGCEGNSCKNSCSSISDCSPGSICTSEKLCVAETAPATADDSSCGCKVPGAPAPRTSIGGLSALFALVLAGRRLRHASKPEQQ